MHFRNSKIKNLEAKIFIYPSSADDKKRIINEIFNFLRNHRKYLHQKMSYSGFLLVFIATIINQNMKTFKYLYFNEKEEKVYLDRTFYDWSKLAVKEIEKVVKTKKKKSLQIKE